MLGWAYFVSLSNLTAGRFVVFIRTVPILGTPAHAWYGSGDQNTNNSGLRDEQKSLHGR
jgi:hypothetical protein